MTAPALTLRWMSQGTALLAGTVAGLGDAEFERPSGLPVWTRKHLLAHLAANAEALRRLTYWARTGEETPMYASTEQRNADIETGSRLPASRLRAWMTEAAARLAEDLDALPADAWANPVATAQGRIVPASEIPWMRAKEVWIHAADLDAGVGFDDFPAELCAALLTDVTGVRSRRHEGHGVLLRSTDSDESWQITGPDPVSDVRGTRAALSRWVTGRGTHGLSPSTPPELGPWL
jgi:maleylpyruvate isomerase